MGIRFLHGAKIFIEFFILKIFKLIFVLRYIDRVYKKIPTYSISKQYRVEQEPDNPDLIYGTLSNISFLYLLNLLHKKGCCKIYDLGCGDARLILSAALFFKDIQATGIEKVSDLVQAAKSARLLSMAKIKKNQSTMTIMEGDFLVVNLEEAHIVYVNGAVFKEATWEQLRTKFSRLQPGSYVISVVRRIHDSQFIPVSLS